MATIDEILRRSELFSGLDGETIDRITRRMKTLDFEAGCVICHERAAGDSMYIIVEGGVSVLKDMGWGQHELKRLGPNEAFGEMSLISEERRSATVKTLSATKCLQLDRAGFSDLLDQDPHFAQRIAKVVTSRLSALNERTSNELLGAYRALMFALADLTDSRDPETGAHLERTRSYCVILAEKLAPLARYSAAISPGFVEELYNVAPLHDIGKVAVPDAILLKPGRLSPEEFEVMKTHTTAGAAAFRKVLGQCDTEVFQTAYRICLHHHEKWDGSGYPTRLAGDAIPLEARIMAMADVYDALLSKRVYKEPMGYEATREEIRKSSGTFFDPPMVEVMLDNIKSFEAIHAKFKDRPKGQSDDPAPAARPD
jgi:response regulator RpfG family c-di-GMP phosphodiesterase